MDDLTILIMRTSQGNPGAVEFCVQAVKDLGATGIQAIQRASGLGIKADKLYMLWNDCLERNTPATCKVLLEWSLQRICMKINYQNGHGLPITKQELFPGTFDEDGSYSVFKSVDLDEVKKDGVHL